MARKKAAAKKAAGEYSPKSGTRSGDAAEEALQRARLTHFRAGGEPSERLRILRGVRALRPADRSPRAAAVPRGV